MSSMKRGSNSMGVNHGGQGVQVPPEFGAGDANANCPPRFCHIGTKMSVLWPSKYAKIRFRPGLCPRLRWGSSRRSPRPLSRLERGHSSRYLTPLGMGPPSALAMRPPRSPARSTPMSNCISYSTLTMKVIAPNDRGMAKLSWPMWYLGPGLPLTVKHISSTNL